MKFNVIRFKLYVTPFSRHITTKFLCPQGELIAVSVGRTRTLESSRGTQRQFSENICSEDDLRSRIFGTFVVKFLACRPLLGFSNI